MHAFDVLGDPVRRRTLELLAARRHTSGEIAAIVGREFGITQSAVSQHLKVLRDHGFATVELEGPRRIYEIDPTPMEEVDRWLGRFRHFWEPKLEALATEVARGRRRRRS
ncbi:MAG: metalloregulator ArsR/SmtB family transcription factor [Thermoanaerobaculia bacterium]|nr:metalloregulator ArsR/SmtB family transcription factor [Thermoanaerobaculia bacterium]